MLTFRVTELPASELHGDAQHLGKTLRRLVENAVKFTPEGGQIEIITQIRQTEDIRRNEGTLKPFSTLFFSQPPPEQMLQITVSDNGVGIDPTEHIRIFDKFYEVGSPDSHFTSRTKFGGKGVGLGLSLVKGVIEAHGGMTWVESPGTIQPGMGSAFHLLLPLPPLPEENHNGQLASISCHSPDR
jgi:signal transduction histidine kinase